ncbi:DEAD/DEAH box helicase [Clostridium estertheticum]|uniref:DEAD/DEAH box helicase n=1 Tax=Clostridium estertheticum TaxID=238834 RepID=UPI001CF36401|nr:DEAD/DEAH box helicase [Clostridium estertheticum]MCB2353138.1 DEAD/DEAH box helicase [Clostridium estertheticum]WAG41494.1 DEAD/DEAH box helicase [Clostridium estertheticum]
MNTEKISDLFDEYEKDSTVQNFIAQANSRYILYNVKEPQENFPKYTEELNEKCTSIALNYLTYGYTFFIKDMMDRAIYSLEKAATILEHIFCFYGCENTYKTYYSVVCALCYYASSQYSKAFIILKRNDTDTTIASLIKLFLTNNLSGLQIVLDEIQFNENIQDDNVETNVYVKILSLYFINIIQYIYSGNEESLEKAKEIICDLIEISSINEEPHLWWVFRLLSLINKDYKRASLWGRVLPIINSDNKDMVKLYILANAYKKNSISQLFKSQIDCLAQVVSDKGAVISIPTSSGKTKIAEIAILKSLIEHPHSMCLYIAPFRALAFEVENSLSSTLGLIGYSVSHLYGSTQYTQIDKALVEDSEIIIATPEKAKAIIRSTDELIERLKLVIIDEGHLIGKHDRYITSELFIDELKVSLKANGGKMLLLSAVLPNLTDFSRWITGEENLIASSNWRPSSQRLGVLDFYKHTVNIQWLGDYESFNNKFIESKLVKAARVAKTGREYPAVYFPKEKKDAVAATAVKLLSLGSVLIYVCRSTMVLSQARIVYKIMLELGISHEWKNQNDLELVKLACEEAYEVNSEILKFAQQGIICHSAKLPTDVRLSIERLMSNGSPKIIIATSTLAQGVNIGISTVIIANVYLDAEKNVDVKDFWNIAGRAGRAFVDTEGKILYAINRDKGEWSADKQHAEMNKYFKQSNIENAISGVYLLLKELYMVSIECGIDYDTLLELISENGVSDLQHKDTERFIKFMRNDFDLIDDTLLSLNIKYNSAEMEDSSSWIDDCFRSSLAYITATKARDFDGEKLIEVLKARNIGVLKIAGDSSNWVILSNSSVPLRVSVAIMKVIADITNKVREYINSNLRIDDLLILIEYIDDIMCELPTNDINSFSDKDTDTSNIRRMWFSGKSIVQINQVDAKAPKICNEYYGFQFPWIANSFAKKMKKLGYEDESKIMENISLLAEVGLPNIDSVKIYLAGIRSREVSVEVSKFIDVDEELGISGMKRLLIDLSEDVTVLEASYSPKVIRWLNVLNAENKRKKIRYIKNVNFKLFRSELIGISKILIKKVNDKYYVCSFDYKIKCEIYPSKLKLFDSIANLKGICFEKKSDKVWMLKSNNPYIVIE